MATNTNMNIIPCRSDLYKSIRTRLDIITDHYSNCVQAYHPDGKDVSIALRKFGNDIKSIGNITSKNNHD